VATVRVVAAWSRKKRRRPDPELLFFERELFDFVAAPVYSFSFVAPTADLALNLRSSRPSSRVEWRRIGRPEEIAVLIDRTIFLD
jgi:hypothetical protein